MDSIFLLEQISSNNTELMEMYELTQSVIKQFKYYKKLGDATFTQLSDDDFFYQYNDESNSIAIVVKHLSGNMLSRWTDFLTTDGEKEWRNRDDEFELDLQTRKEILERWEIGWDCLFKALDSISQNNIHEMVYIRNMGHTIPEAVNRQLAHYAYHIGQVVYIGRMLRGKQWKSLSIPKGNSDRYNFKKFKKPKHREHFTDELLDEE